MLKARICLLIYFLATISLAPICSARASANPKSGPSKSAAAAAQPDSSPVQPALDRFAQTFIENAGQADARAPLYMKGRDATVFFTQRGLSLALAHDTGLAIERWNLALDFLNANPSVRPTGRDPVPAAITFFEGSADRWQTGVRAYTSVVYADVWPGVDLVFRIADGRFKYEFAVRPNADPSQIRLRWRGATDVDVDTSGGIDVVTPMRTIRDEAPVSFQNVDGRQTRVATSYKVVRDDDANAWDVRFTLGDYDSNQSLLIDPTMLVYSGFLGGSSADFPADVAIDADGNLYVTGATISSEARGFPVAVGPDTTYNPREACGNLGSPASDTFVAKVSADGSGIVYCGYIGGECNQLGNGIAVDSAGNAYVVGITLSDQTTFPVRIGPRTQFATQQPGVPQGDGFIAKVNASGTQLVYCGYINGDALDYATDVAVDSTGAAYVTGATRSSNFPVTTGPDLTIGGEDAFIVKVRPDGSGFAYAGFIGGSGDEEGLGVAVDSAGNAYISGATTSTNLPVVGGPGLTYSGDPIDGFVAKVLADGTGFSYLGYLGGARYDSCTRIAVNPAGEAFVVGVTNSTESSFPVRVGPDLTYNGTDASPLRDAFVARVRADGTGLVFCGYIGGAGDDIGADISLDADSNAVVVGSTTSTETTFPLVGADDETFGGGADIGDAFIAKVPGDGASLSFSTFLGGAGDDAATSVVLDAKGFAYITGQTYSDADTFPVMGGPSLTRAGLGDAFVIKLLIEDGPPRPTITSVEKVGKKLFVTGTNFDSGAVILLNGEAKKTKRTGNPPTSLNSKKAGKVVKAGDKIKVRNGDGIESNEVTF